MSEPTHPDLHPAGDPLYWSRDMALLGGLVCLQAPMIGPLFFGVKLGLLYILATGIMGALTGAVLGWMVGATLSGPGRRWPLSMMILIGPFIGLMWGCTVGAVSSVALPGSHNLFSAEGFVLSTAIAGIAGSLQFGWFWFPYAWLRVKKRTSWPLVLFAITLGMPLGFLSTVSFLFINDLFRPFDWLIF
mgnify:CR=1 FL=1